MMTQSCSMPARFQALDAWRGICAILVVLFHAPFLHSLHGAPTLANLQLCVDFFFVLSGFVLSRAYQDRLRCWPDGARFMATRFRRLWPLHVTLLVVLVVVELVKLRFGRINGDLPITAAAFSEGHTTQEIVTNLLFLQGFGLHPGLTWNGPAWSIAAEFWVSGVFAAIVLLAPRRHLVLMAVLVPASGLALWAVSPDTMFVNASWTMLRCMLGFFTGCLVFAARLRLPAPVLPYGAAELACVLLAAVFLLGTNQGPAQLAVPLVAGLLIYVFSFERGPLSAALKGRVPQALGRWSFSIYMTHVMVFQFVLVAAGALDNRLGTHLVVMANGNRTIAFGDPAVMLPITMIFVVLVVVPVGAVCFGLIEQPLGRLMAPGLRVSRRLVPLASSR